MNRDLIRNIVENVLAERAVLIDAGKSPLKYRGYANTRNRLILVDESVPTAPPNTMFFTDYIRWRRFKKRGGRLKKPVIDEFIPGAPPHTVAFQDWSYYLSKDAIYLDYIYVRDDMRGRGYARKLIQGLIDMHPNLTFLHFGKMMRKEIGHLKDSFAEKYKGKIDVVGGVNY